MIFGLDEIKFALQNYIEQIRIRAFQVFLQVIRQKQLFFENLGQSYKNKQALRNLSKYYLPPWIDVDVFGMTLNIEAKHLKINDMVLPRIFWKMAFLFDKYKVCWTMKILK